MRHTPLVFALSVVFSSSVAAEAVPEFVGATVVVTPTRLAQPLSDALQHTTLISRTDIENATALDLPTLLRQESGVEIAQTGGIGTQAAIRIRGSEADHVLVLVDGIRMNSATTGAAAIDQILLDEIDRIEIVRGNVSSVYGSEAIGGVVQIFTRRGAGPLRALVTAGAGVDNYRKLSVAVRGATGDGRVYLGVSRTGSDGFSAVDPQYIPGPFSSLRAADADRDGYRNTTVNLSFSRRLAEAQEIGINALLTRGDIHYDGSSQNHSDQNLSTVGLFSQNRITDYWQSRIQISQSTDDLKSDLDGTPTDRFRTQNRQLTWTHELTTGAGDFTFGGEGLWQTLESSQDYSRTSRRVASAFGGYLFKHAAHEIQLNFRHDSYSDFGPATTGLVGYGIRINQSLRLSGTYSSAYKAPTFNELYTKAFAPWYVGNPDLEPEKARTAELGLAYTGLGGLARVTLFDTRTRGLIASSTDPVTFYSRPVNVDQASNTGVELSWTGTLFNLDARAALTLQHPEDDKTGEALLRRADQFGSLSVGQKRERFDWHAEVLASGPRPDIHVTEFTRTTVPGYAVVNVALGRQISPDWKLRAKVVNVFDKEYALVHGYGTQGRGAFVELAYSPK